MSGIERRRYPRLEINAEIEYIVLDQADAEVFTTGSKNLSSGGVCIIAFEKLEPGTLLSIKFSVPELHNKIVIARGKVAWVKAIRMGGRDTDIVYEVGVEFIDIKEGDREQIKKFVMLKTRLFIVRFIQRLKTRFFAFFKKSS